MRSRTVPTQLRVPEGGRAAVEGGGGGGGEGGIGHVLVYRSARDQPSNCNGSKIPTLLTGLIVNERKREESNLYSNWIISMNRVIQLVSSFRKFLLFRRTVVINVITTK